MLNNIIEGDSLSELTDKAITLILTKGEKRESRNGGVTMLNNVIVQLNNPLSRHLKLEGRNNNIYATMAEMFWIMSGRDTIDPFLSYFLPRAKDYSDDGTSWRGGYGPRLYMDEQLQNAIKVFKTDGLDTRRSIISIYDSGLDSGVTSKDIPCNNLIHFLVDRDGLLNMNVFSRSSDVLWGLFGINIPEWTFLQEYVAQQVGVKVGVYSHFTSNMHIYDDTIKQASAVFKADQSYSPIEATRPCIFPEDHVRCFFRALLDIYSREITEYSSAYYLESSVDKLFFDNNVPTTYNALYDYAILIAHYISGKQGDTTIGFNAYGISQELVNCVRTSKFTNFIGSMR